MLGSRTWRSESESSIAQAKKAHADVGVDDYKTVANTAVSKFKKFTSLMDRTKTAHARFRRGTVPNIRESEPVDQKSDG